LGGSFDCKPRQVDYKSCDRREGPRTRPFWLIGHLPRCTARQCDQVTCRTPAPFLCRSLMTY